jgi:dienelactone hydrolase
LSTVASAKERPRWGSPRARMQRLWPAVANWCREQATTLVGHEASRGGLWGLIVVLALFVAVHVAFLSSGYGVAFDAAFVTATTMTVIALLGLIVAVILAALRKLPLAGTSIFVAACVVMTVGSFSQPSISLGVAVIAFCLAVCVCGATLRALASSRAAASGKAAKTLGSIVCIAATAYVVGFVWVLADTGNDEKLSSWRPRNELMPPNLTASNPGSSGTYAVRTLLYGSGTDLRRDEYRSGVALKTHSVDASAFFRGYSGWRRWARSHYWGFDVDKLPLNARVWYPEGTGPFPLVLIAHGNHRMNDFSDPGYGYLGELLASRGFILASVDQNFLNGIPGFRDPTAMELPRSREHAVRGWHLLEHLRLWHEWNGQAGNPFYGKVDVSRIALMGHSRGGEAAATAVAFNRMKYYPEDATVRFNYGYDLRAIVAIAPSDGQYQPAQQSRWVEDVSYLTLQGAQDADGSSFAGSRQADRVRFTRPGPWFSTEIWAYRANHGQFNTGWGSRDHPAPLGWFLNLEPLMTGDEQRRISKTYISAFLEATLNGRREYVPLFKDWRAGRQWLPDTIYINRYRDASFVPVATFQEDADLTSATAEGAAIDGDGFTLWREGRIPTRRGDRGYNGVFLGWYRTPARQPAVYSIALPRDAASRWRLSDHSTGEVSLAPLDQNAPVPPGAARQQVRASDERPAPEFTIELVSSDGTTVTAPSSRFADIPPPLKEKFTKFNFVERDRYGNDWEPVFQTVRAPLSAFTGVDGHPLDPQQLVALRVRFDRTPTSVICISGIGFGSE